MTNGAIMVGLKVLTVLEHTKYIKCIVTNLYVLTVLEQTYVY